MLSKRNKIFIFCILCSLLSSPCVLFSSLVSFFEDLRSGAREEREGKAGGRYGAPFAFLPRCCCSHSTRQKQRQERHGWQMEILKAKNKITVITLTS